MKFLDFAMGEEAGLGDVVAERNILYDRLVPVEWGEITTILVNDVYPCLHPCI